MKLIIAEKPSVAGDIAKALGGFRKNQDWYESSDAIITSAIGHLVELHVPEADSAFDMLSLPVIPEQFGLAVVDKTSKQFALVKKLINRQDVTTVVNACDAGREGELIFRYIYLLAGCRKPIERMWLQSMTPNAIKEAHVKLRAGHEYQNLFDAARCRSEADWLIGINATRASSNLYTHTTGAREKISAGRVQTPTLAIMVERELAIRNFKPQDYWEVIATFGAVAGQYEGKWCKSKTETNDADEGAQSRITKAELAAQVVNKCAGQPVKSVQDESKPLRSVAPKLFDLTSLQRECNARLGLSAKETLDIAQALYEKHKVLTYPRTDSTALPEDYIETAKRILGELTDIAGEHQKHAQAALDNGWVKPDKRIFDNSKISDHFAIIPTGKDAQGGLSVVEARVYGLVVRRFIAAFFPPAEYLQTVRLTVVADETFRTSGKVLQKEGWLAVYGANTDEDDKSPPLPKIAPSEVVKTLSVVSHALKTKPPVRFNEATLLSAMENAGKSIEDEALREAMKERGLGTPATRAATIEKLLAVGYISREGKQVVPTTKGIDFIRFLQGLKISSLVSAATTGDWEHKLRLMERGQHSRAEFMAAITAETREIVKAMREQMNAVPAAQPATTTEAMDIPCPQCGGTIVSKKNSYNCTSCQFILWKEVAGHRLTEKQARTLLSVRQISKTKGFVNKAQKPFEAGLKISSEGKVEFVFDETPVASNSPEKPALPCPSCGKAMRRRSGPKGWFWGCTGYPDCRTTMQDNNGQPMTSAPNEARATSADRALSRPNAINDIPEAAGQKCPSCGEGKLERRLTKESRKPFLGCTKFPKCRHFTWIK